MQVTHTTIRIRKIGRNVVCADTMEWLRHEIRIVMPVIRSAMVDYQRKIAGTQSFVIDGRDIASNVLPNAKYKFFLTASSEKRAERRLLELEAKGDKSQSYEEVLKDIIQRDKQDSERAASPLIKVPEAVEINTDEIGIEETLETLLSYVKE